MSSPRITSRRNPRLQRLRKLLRDPATRREEGSWVVEGVRLVRDALEAGVRLREAAVSPRLEDREEALLAALEARGIPLLRASDDALESVAAVETSQGVLLEIEAPDPTVELVPDDLVVVAAGVGDPGNLGAVARVVEGAGARGLFLLEGSVDPGNPKALRASAGSLLRLPVERIGTEELLGRLGEAGYRIVTARSEGEEIHDRLDWSGSWALVVGPETGGIPEVWQSAATCSVRIPMRRVESLNLATATAVILFEAERQRREG